MLSRFDLVSVTCNPQNRTSGIVFDQPLQLFARVGQRHRRVRSKSVSENQTGSCS